jgi:transglutaminase-like putative cysteine protease
MKFTHQSFAGLAAALLGGYFLIYASLPRAGHPDALSTAEKAVIHETLNTDGTVVQVEELTKVVRSQLAIESESQADLPFNSSFETLEVLEAYTITPQGNKILVAPNAIRIVEDDNAKGAAIFSDQKHVIIIFPNVSVGSRTYYKTKLITKQAMMPGFFYSHFSFYPQIDYEVFEYTLTYPADRKLYIDTKDVNIGSVDNLPNGMKRLSFSYQTKDFHLKEQLQVSSGDFAPYFRISTMDSQETFAKAYEARTKSRFAVTPEVQKLANDITKGIDDPKEQAKALYNWVTREIRYVAIFLGDGGIIPHSANTVIKNRYGDCKDHNVLLIALLNAKGIEASSALINSGSAYELPKYPIIAPLNHVITYLPKWNLYVDSTSELAPFGVLPQDELDKPTILTKLGKVGRTPRPLAENNQVITGVKMTITDDGKIKGSSHTNYLGTAEINARIKYEGADTNLVQRMVRNHFTRFRQTGEGTFKLSPVYDLNQPFEVDGNFTLDAVANVPGPGAMTIPVGLGPGELATIANDRPPEKFRHPYACSTRIVSEDYDIEFPNNVKVTRIPIGVSYKKDGIQYTSSYSQNGNTITAARKLIVQRPSAICQPTEVQKWKAFYQVFIKDMRGQIFYE